MTTIVNKPKNIAVLGATGSIGLQALDIIERSQGRYRASVLAAGSQVDKLIELALTHKPDLAIIADEKKYQILRGALQPLGIKTAAGAKALEEAAAAENVDMVLTATVGYSGLAPTIVAIKANKDIALANKETLVVAGALIEKLQNHSHSKIYPVDSEHSAIYQCLQGEDMARVNRLIITASGGPFRTWTTAQIANATVEDALNHPNWHMGAKITIDSATMLNKAFEIIEARWLFKMPPSKITPVVHPQSIIHSMVEYADGAVKAQLGTPDMRLPIAYALGEATRDNYLLPPLTLQQMSVLTFMEPDLKKFPCLDLAYYALEKGGNSACIINAANEIAVAAFLHGKISFPQIYTTITEALAQMPFILDPTYEDYVATNAETRALAQELIEKNKK
ncbi:MAG: 1-deoxy-D-xylulose-5-phosphate reductoisomerase [Bacteroidales bacterium]|nr:1-deoxy-D-xylulose-5-phosphate reductoisomerase [Bacteroidales bacterium]